MVHGHSLKEISCIYSLLLLVETTIQYIFRLLFLKLSNRNWAAGEILHMSNF